MIRFPFLVAFSLGCLFFGASIAAAEDESAPSLCGEWTRLPPIPDRHGFAGMIAGVCDGRVFAAGGANFPEAPPWQGGRKVWYDSIFVLNRDAKNWSLLPQRLPRQLGYAVSVTWNDQVVIVGGETSLADRPGSTYSERVYAMKWWTDHLEFIELPSLPFPISNACGAMLGSRLYLAGGSRSPTATETLKTFLMLDLSDPAEKRGWKSLAPWPGRPRMLATAAATSNSFYLVGGTDLSPGEQRQPVRTYLKDAYRYSPETGWTQIADVPRPVVAATTPAPTQDGMPLILSGDDGSEAALAQAERTGFSRAMLLYQPGSNQWNDIGRIPAPTVTVPCVFWRDGWLVISGEQRPGVRSPDVWKLKLKSTKADHADPK